MEIKETVKEVYENAERHGFWEDYNEIFNIEMSVKFRGQMINNAIGNRLMLISGEVSEAHEGLRKNDTENFKEELADIVIRVMDLCGGLKIDLEAEIKAKMEKNKERPYKHGKSF